MSRQKPPTLTHAHEGPVTVFHIGMTIRRPHRPDLWGPVLMAMPRMIRELERNRDDAAGGRAEDLGFLGGDFALSGHGPWMVQFWRTPELLQAYARDPARAHLPAWKAFNAGVRRSPGAVGVWHETYVVPADGIETLYVNGARVGLGRIAGTIPVERRGVTARERLGATREAPGPSLRG
ncbi:DUF4188 domain-containing protein [Brachybacterium sp. JHP9]|uniref:DUF4188 domain-containing protein n=1 Tax=Brachybacterium equifaecis TaxID=2910770 RepID=A0ABT0QZP5_9MICO|nr:DUF4188 domain-containing protein [Brachybacterium equifaecis]MCL6423122.1 DUF4188 domain-containing protein [Brachybacterium equifaecis]